jgi:hypothetical protein
VPQKGKSSYNPVVAVEKPTTGHIAEQFPEKGQSKNSGETSNLLIFDLPSFFLHLGNFLLSSPGLFFLISSFSLIIFDLPPSNVFVSRTLQRQVRVPTGATAGSLRRATHNAPRRRNHHRQKPPSPESRSPASDSDQHRSNYGQSFSFLAEICHQERTICSVNLRNPSYLVDAQVR